MRATKTVVFAALVVALAVNVELFKSPVNPGMPSSNASVEHDEPYPCSLDPGWQCNNTYKWYVCHADTTCVLDNGLVI